MRKGTRTRGAIGFAAFGFIGFVVACGASRGNSADTRDGSASNNDGFNDPLGLGGDGGPVGPGGCVNFQCKQVACAEGKTTRLTGTVFSPARISPDPLPNVVVYVPNSAVAPFATDGITCDRCGASVSGSPLVTTLSATDGTFALDNVPVGKDIPLVIQTGHWRRQVTIPSVTECADNALDPELTRLPRNKSEGDIPKMAFQSGSQDPLECTLRKLIDDSEFTPSTGDGRVHFYHGNGLDMSPSAPSGTTLTASLDNLKQYDLVVLGCDGATFDTSTEAAHNLIEYANQGGRLYNLHHGGDNWLRDTAPFSSVGEWNLQADPTSPLRSTVDTTFPKGAIFADWLQLVGATTTRGTLDVVDPQHYLDNVNPPAQTWVSSATPKTIQHFTFNTPLDAGADAQCGRVLFTVYHVSEASKKSGGSGTFPSKCKDGALSPNEKLVEYMLFDLTACVQNDAEVPTAPPIR